MRIVLERQPSGISCTIGKLYIDGQFECFTLEDLIREIPGQPVESWKVYGKSAIPSGKYRVIVNMSSRFKRELPLLVDVPGFTGVRIHPGNTDEDTEGCILVGTRVAPHGESIEQSRAAFDRLFEKIEGALESGEEIIIEVRNP